MSAASYPLGMVVPTGRAIHAIDPANGQPACSNRSSKWSKRPAVIRRLPSAGQPTCHYCRKALGL